ncbi:MAG: HD domain-containing protein [Treponema sp.]|nr:HD domain-containing protein [Treponema sp.]
MRTKKKRKRQSDLKAILRIDSELNGIQDLDILLERILLEARKLVRADAGSIYIYQPVEENGKKADKLAIKYSQNETLQRGLPAGQKLIYSVFSIPVNDKTISGYCALTRKLVNVPDAYNLPAGAPYSFGKSYDQVSGYKTTSILTVPLTSAEGSFLGVIQMINSTDKYGKTVPFTADDELLITHFASTASTALLKAQIMRAMILRLVKMAELRDPKETGTHVNRVASYAVEIYDRWASRRGIPEKDKFKDNMKIASMLHDAGKVAIPDAILKKPDRFTLEERQTMQVHTIYGAALFDDPQSPLDDLSRDIALTHHENWNGTGYPGWVDPFTGTPIKTGEDGKALGKKGDEIPLAGRIVSIADVFDALWSRRIYKEPWAEEDILKEIRDQSGVKFDPELVDIFFEILPSIKQIQQLYPEAG